MNGSGLSHARDWAICVCPMRVLRRSGNHTGVLRAATLHDAVAHEPGDGEQEVVEVLRAGYRWKGRVVRPAMVKVRG